MDQEEDAEMGEGRRDGSHWKIVWKAGILRGGGAS